MSLPTWLLIIIILISLTVGQVVKLAPATLGIIQARLERDKFEHAKNLDRLEQLSRSFAADRSRFELLARLLDGEPPLPDSLRRSSNENLNSLVDIQRARSEAAQALSPLIKRLSDIQNQEEALRRRLVGDPQQDYDEEFRTLTKTLEFVRLQIDAAVARLLASPRLYVFKKMPENMEQSGVPLGGYFVVTEDD